MGMSPVMIGRAAALDRLIGLLDAAEVGGDDQPHVALVSGEPGIGKSRLLHELAHHVAEDVTVLSGQAQPGSLGRAFHVLTNVVDDGASLAPDEVGRLALERILDAAATGRVLLLLEDLHWADADSVAVIDAVAQAARPQLVIVGTYRPSDLSRGSPGGELILRLERRHNVEQIRLDRLDRAEVGLLLGVISGRPADSGTIEAVHRRSAGVPFVIEELLRSAPDLGHDDLIDARLPWTLDDAVRQQIAGLGPNERLVVEAIAVYGRPINFDLLGSLTGFDEPARLAALRELSQRGVIVEPSEDRFWFTHALVADVVAGQLLGRERRALHQRAASALLTQPHPDGSALAEHLMAAGRYDEAVEVARGAAREALARGASFAALRLAHLALAEEPDDVGLLAIATEAAWRLDFRDEAAGYATRWLERSSGGVDRAEALRLRGRLAVELDDDEVAGDVMAQLVAREAALDVGAERARLRGALAQLHMLLGNRDDVVHWADLAIADADAIDDQYVATQARIERGSAWGDGNEGDADDLRDAIERARLLGDGVLEARGINNLLHNVPVRSAESDRLLGDLIRVTHRIGFDKLAHEALQWQLRVSQAQADLAAFRRTLDEVLPYWTRWPSGVGNEQPNEVVTFLALEEGRVADARRALERDGPIDDFRGARLLRLGHIVQLGALTGDAALATAAAREIPRRRRGKEPTDLNTLLSVVDAALVAGVDRATVEAAVESFGPSPRASRLADALVATTTGGSAGADEVAAALASGDEDLTLRVRGTLRLAEAQARLGDGREGAQRALDQATTDLARWPGWRRDRVDALRRRLEGGRRRPDGGLTRRETEVASLIAEGLTNGQLAERLYISPKTAAVHVSNILAKLGLSGRAEVAAWAVRHGVAADEG